MSYYVLRQIKPLGKTAFAHEATLMALTMAAATGTIESGPYLQASDPDYNNGQGREWWTDDIADAKRFASFMDAMDCWKAQSTVVPFRPDGKPNRPLTAYSIEPLRIEEDK